MTRGIWPRWSPVERPPRLRRPPRVELGRLHPVRPTASASIRVTDDPALDTRPAWAADGRRADRAVGPLESLGPATRVAGRRPRPAERLTDHAAARTPPRQPRRPHDRLRRRPRPPRRLDPDARPRQRVGPPSPGPAPTATADPAWSPDGRSIAFVGRRPGADTRPRRPTPGLDRSSTGVPSIAAGSASGLRGRVDLGGERARADEPGDATWAARRPSPGGRVGCRGGPSCRPGRAPLMVIANEQSRSAAWCCGPRMAVRMTTPCRCSRRFFLIGSNWQPAWPGLISTSQPSRPSPAIRRLELDLA